MPEMLERADADDPVYRLVKLLPALQQNAFGAGAVGFREQVLDVVGLVLAQGEADNVDVVALHRAHHGGAPAAADVEQSHARLESEFAQREIDLGDLRLFQRHVIALEVRAAVGLGGVQEQPEKVVGQVVMGLHVVKVRRQIIGHPHSVS